jgi:hypothetical protein
MALAKSTNHYVILNIAKSAFPILTCIFFQYSSPDLSRRLHHRQLTVLALMLHHGVAAKLLLCKYNNSSNYLSLTKK